MTNKIWRNGVLDVWEIDGVQQEITDEIRKQNPPTRKHTIAQPIPCDQWPIWAKALKWFAIPEDKGIGDIVWRKIGDENSEAFKAWHLATFGKPCNCTARRERWNRQYPLDERI